MVIRFALECIEHLILEGKQTVDVTLDGYWRYNNELDRHEALKIYTDPRANNYYKNEHGRSAANSPFDIRQMWAWLRRPEHHDAAAGPDRQPVPGGDRHGRRCCFTIARLRRYFYHIQRFDSHRRRGVACSKVQNQGTAGRYSFCLRESGAGAPNATRNRSSHCRQLACECDFDRRYVADTRSDAVEVPTDNPRRAHFKVR